MWSFAFFLGLGVLLALPYQGQCCRRRRRSPTPSPTPAPTVEISPRCLQCICEVESGCTENILCGDNGRSCGPYQIMRTYWSDAGSPGNGYRCCVSEMACAEQTVRGYMKRYATVSRLGRTPTCEDFARIHNGGPNGYKKSSTITYWTKIRSRGCTRNC